MFYKLAVTVANDLIFVELGSRQQSFFLFAVRAFL